MIRWYDIQINLILRFLQRYLVGLAYLVALVSRERWCIRHVDFVELIVDVDVALESVFEELLEGLLLSSIIADRIFVPLFYLELEVADDGAVVCEIHLLHAAVIQLLHFCISTPENAVAEGGNALLFAGIVSFRAQIVFVRWLEVDGTFLELVEEQLHVLLVAGLLLLNSLARRLAVRFFELYVDLRLVFAVVEAGQRERVLVQELDESMLFDLLQDVPSIHPLDPEVEVAHEEHVLVMNDRHPPMAQILLESAVEDLH